MVIDRGLSNKNGYNGKSLWGCAALVGPVKSYFIIPVFNG